VILLLSTFYFQFFRSLILYTISVSTIEPLEGASIFHHSEALFENWLLKITDIDVKLFMMYQLCIQLKHSGIIQCLLLKSKKKIRFFKNHPGR